MLGESESGQIERFKAKAREFSRAYNDLIDMRPDAERYPELAKEWDQLKNYGDRIRSVVEGFTGTVDSAWDWFTGTFGLDGVYYARDQLEGLGIAPAIPVVLGMGGITALTWFVNKVYNFERKLNVARQLESEGKIKPGDILPALDSGIFADIGNAVRKNIIPISVLGVALVFLMNQRQ